MPRIPIYNPQVTPDIPRISTPDLVGSRAPESAFGGDVARAKGTISKVLDPLAKVFGDRAEKIRQYDNAVHGSNINKAFMQDLKDRLYSDKEESAIKNGQKVKQARGWLNRRYEKADGSTRELGEWYDKKREEYLNAIPDEDTRVRISQSMDRTYASSVNSLIKHEVGQKQAYRENSQMELIITKQEAFAAIQTEQGYSEAVDDLDKDLTILYDIQDKNPQQRATSRNTEVQKATERLLQSLMIQDPAGKTARALIRTTDKLLADNKKSLKTMVDNQVKENKETYSDNIRSSILENGATEEVLAQISNGKELLGPEETDKLLKKASDIQKKSLNKKTIDVLFNQDIITEKQADLIEDTRDSIEGFISNPVDAIDARKKLIDLMADGLTKEEAQTIQQMNDEILGSPEKRSIWQGVHNVAELFFITSPGNFNALVPYIMKLIGSKDVEGVNEEGLRQEYNKVNPQTPVSKKDNVIDRINQDNEVWGEEEKQKNLGFDFSVLNPFAATDVEGAEPNGKIDKNLSIPEKILSGAIGNKIADIVSGGMTLQEAEDFRDATLESGGQIPQDIADASKMIFRMLGQDITKGKNFLIDPIGTINNVLNVKRQKELESNIRQWDEGKQATLNLLGRILTPFGRVIEGVRSSVGSIGESIPDILQSGVKGFLKPEEIDTLTSKIPMAQWEREGESMPGSIIRLLPRAIAEGMETVVIAELTLGLPSKIRGVKSAKAKEAVTKAFDNARKNPQMKSDWFDYVAERGGFDRTKIGPGLEKVYDDFLNYTEIKLRNDPRFMKALAEKQPLFTSLKDKLASEAGLAKLVPSGSDIPKISQPGKIGSVSKLIQEAKKFKSAEEFVEGQGKTFYHGTEAKEDFEKFDLSFGLLENEPMAWFTLDKEIAERYAIYKHGKVKEFYLSANNILSEAEARTVVPDQDEDGNDNWDYADDSDLERDSFGLNEKEYKKFPSWEFADVLAKKAKELGRDGILTFDNAETLSGKGLGIAVFSESQIKTKKELVDIYNKVNRRKIEINRRKIKIKKDEKEKQRELILKSNALPSGYTIEERAKYDYLGNPVMFKKLPMKEYAIRNPSGYLITDYYIDRQYAIDKAIEEEFGITKEERKQQLTALWQKAQEGKEQLFTKDATDEQKLLEFKPFLEGEGFIGYSKRQSSDMVKMIKSLPENVSKAEAAKILAKTEKQLSGKQTDTSKKQIREVTGQTKDTTKILSESQALKDRFRNFQRGVREGQKDIKDVKKDIRKFIEENVPKADQGAFLTSLERVTEDNLSKEIDTIINRAEKLAQTEAKKSIQNDINKELKATKPIKKGTKSVGKYDLENNRLFTELRQYSKMTKGETQEALSLFPEEGLKETDLIRKRMLSLKANGTEASVEIYDAVLRDIKEMKNRGAQAKSDAEFEKSINRAKEIDEVSKGIDRSKTKKGSFASVAESLYIKGFGNTYSMLNTVAGKNVAETLDPEPLEMDRNTNVFYATRDVYQEMSDIFNLGGAEKGLDKYYDMLADKRTITDVDGLTFEINKPQVLDIYNAIKNDNIRARYFNQFGKENILDLVNDLSPQEQEFADFLMDDIKSYYPVFNEDNIYRTGKDLGRIKEYWPSTTEKQAEVFDDFKFQSETASPEKARSESEKLIPIPKDAIKKYFRHVQQAEHISNLSRQYETLKNVFSDRKVKHQITEKYGDKAYQALMDQIEEISLNKQIQRADIITDAIGKLVNNWVVAKIALNPTVFARQLNSIILFSENMGTGEWSSGFAKGISKPKETFDYMWKNAPFLEARFNRGYSEALQEAVQGAELIGKNWNDWTKFLSSWVRSGDISAIIYGGYPLVQSEIAKGKTKKQAFETFKRKTLKTQQSGLASGRSRLQNNTNPIAKMFLAFKNTISQFTRAQADAIISYKNGDIGTKQFAKTTALYSVIMPMMYVLSGLLVNELGFKQIGAFLRGEEADLKDGEEVVQAVAVGLMSNYFNAVPILDDAATFASRKLVGAKTYGVFSTPLISDLEKSIQKADKKEITGKDWIDIFTTPVEATTSLPVGTGFRYFKYLTGQFKSGRKRRTRTRRTRSRR